LSSPGHNLPLYEHLVQFYETDAFLLDTLGEFIGAGLGSGAACILIATQAHREELLPRLLANGLDPARIPERYLVLDAAETLAQFLEAGLPDPQRFARVIGAHIEQAERCAPRVRIFGEIVALLWQLGNLTAAVQLEALWNELHSPSCQLSLLSGTHAKQKKERIWTATLRSGRLNTAYHWQGEFLTLAKLK
jgi:hypothetical protein